MSSRCDSSIPPRRTPGCSTCRNRDTSEWCALGSEEIQFLNQDKHTRSYRRGQTLFRQGAPWDGLYCIEAGTVAMRRADAQGLSILVRLGCAGQTVGYEGLFSGGVHGVTAEVIEAATICHISGKFLRGALARNPMLVQRYLSRLAGDLDSAEDVLLKRSAQPVRIRLVHLLLMLKERFVQVEGGVNGDLVIALPLSRQDLAALLGTRPETVARTISALQADGVVRFDKRRAIVADVNTLLHEVEPVSA